MSGRCPYERQGHHLHSALEVKWRARCLPGLPTQTLLRGIIATTLSALILSSLLQSSKFKGTWWTTSVTGVNSRFDFVSLEIGPLVILSSA